jgi:hypothetical protein
MTYVTHRALGLAVALSLIAAANQARADEPTKEQCISANESAQVQRQSRKLRAARASLLV